MYLLICTKEIQYEKRETKELAIYRVWVETRWKGGNVKLRKDKEEVTLPEQDLFNCLDF